MGIIEIDELVHKKLKLIAVERETTLKDLINNILNSDLDKELKKEGFKVD